jgi:hypothetical protein
MGKEAAEAAAREWRGRVEEARQLAIDETMGRARDDVS